MSEESGGVNEEYKYEHGSEYDTTLPVEERIRNLRGRMANDEYQSGFAACDGAITGDTVSGYVSIVLDLIEKQQEQIEELLEEMSDMRTDVGYLKCKFPEDFE